jgi:hypothetical protein
MQPLAVLNGIIFGSSVAIFLGLAVVLLLYGLNLDQAEWVRGEMVRLAVHAVLFGGLMAVSGLAFYAVLREFWWRWYAELALLAALAAVVMFYWPD